MPKRVQLPAICALLLLLTALPALAAGGAAVEVDGLTFDSRPDFLRSEYFQASGLRCGVLVTENEANLLHSFAPNAKAISSPNGVDLEQFLQGIAQLPGAVGDKLKDGPPSGSSEQ